MSKSINLELLNQATDNIQAEVNQLQKQTDSNSLYTNLALLMTQLLALNQLNELIGEYKMKLELIFDYHFTKKQIRIVNDVVNNYLNPYYSKAVDLLYSNQFQNQIDELFENAD